MKRKRLTAALLIFSLVFSTTLPGTATASANGPASMTPSASDRIAASGDSAPLTAGSTSLPVDGTSLPVGGTAIPDGSSGAWADQGASLPGSNDGSPSPAIHNATAALNDAVSASAGTSPAGSPSPSPAQGRETVPSSTGTAKKVGPARASTADYLDIGSCGTNLSYTLSSNGVLSITGEGDMANYSDANSVPWFKYRSLITTVTFSGKITSIGSYAFDYCVNLENIAIPDNVTGIGAYSFYGCHKLTGITLPPALAGLGAYSFAGCTGLTSVSIPGSAATIGDYAFSGCTNLTDITIPDSVTSIGKGAFDHTGIDDTDIAYRRGSCGTGLTWALLGGKRLYIYGSGAMDNYTAGTAPWYSSRNAIQEVVLSEGISSIGDYAFQGCQSIRSVSLADSVGKIGRYAFAQCASVSGITLNHVTEISDYGFYQSGMEKIDLSGSRTVTMGNYAFAGCTSLKSASLDNIGLHMGSYVFYGCPALKKVSISAAFDAMGSHMFANCTALSEISLIGGCTEIGASMFSGCTSIKAISLPGQVTSLGSGAFQGCTGITRITLPDSVTDIGNNVFAGCSALEDILFSKKLKAIGANAFKDCTGFTALEIPDTVTAIGSGALSGCSSLERVTLPFAGDSADASTASAQTVFGHIFGQASYKDSTAVKQSYSDTASGFYYLPNSLVQVSITGGELLYGAFDHCSALKNISLPDSLTKIDSCAFRGCEGLEKLELPQQITDLGNNVFDGCTGLKDITLPDSLQNIGNGAFSGCTGLVSVSLPKKITVLGKNLFLNCTGLQNADLPNAIQAIGDYAFKGCTALKSISLPAAATQMGAGAFQGCTRLQQAALPNGITSIEKETFSGCSALEDITLPNDAKAIGDGAFKDCCLLKDITLPAALTDIGPNAFSGCCALESIQLPNQVADIGSNAFKDCAKITAIKLPDSVKTIGNGALSGCSGLKSISLPFLGGKADEENPSSSTVFGYIFGSAKYTGSTAITQNYSTRGTAAYYIPDTLTSVTLTGGKMLFGAFSGYTHLEHVTLTSSDAFTQVGQYAFSGCTGLTGLSVPDGVTALGGHALFGCTSLQSVSLPGSLEDIGEYCFGGCTGLEAISLPKNTATIGTYAFQNCSALESITVPDSVTAIQASAFSGCSSLASMVLPFAGGSNDLTSPTAKSLFGYIFGNTKYTGGTMVKQNYSVSSASYCIPDTLKEVTVTGGDILYGTFSGCSGITAITLPGTLGTIANYAFYNCSSLREINLPAAATSIGSYAFAGCSSLRSVSLPANITSMGSYAWKDCTGLREFTIPGKVKKIESYAFSGCTGLKQIDIPQNVTEVGTYAFQNCSGLTSITIPDTVTSIQIAALSGCSGLESITLPFIGANASLSTPSAQSVLGFIFGTQDYAGSVRTQQFYSSSSAAYYLPSSLRKVTVTGGTVLYGAFYNCSGLTGITLPNNLAEIGQYAFCGCFGLAQITLPAAVTSIGSYAFKDCTGLKTFCLPDKVKTIENYTFAGCTGLEAMTIPEGTASIGTYAFQNCSSLANIIVPDSVTSIQASAFSGCSSLENMTLPFVGSDAAQVQASAKTLFGYIFGTANYSGATATRQYYSNSSVVNYIPASLRTVVITGGNLLYGAFYNCSGLTYITLPHKGTSIGKNAFNGCTGLTGIILPDKTSDIQANAFNGCTGIKSITFSGNAPSSIDSTAFTGVTSTVYYPKADTTWASLIGNQYGGTLSWEAHTHQYQPSVTAPTCTEQGYTTYRCSSCGSYYTNDYVPALGHTLVADPAVQASCTKPGMTEGAHCSVCQAVITPQQTVQATGHRFTDYTSNKDATYDADGTKTALCDYGCGIRDTITDTGSQLTDSHKPSIEITCGTNTWNSFLHAITFGIFFQKTQTAAVTATDQEKLLDGSLVSRLDKTYYCITDTAMALEQLEDAAWTEYTGTLSLNPDKKYIIYAKAVDLSGNTAYASSDGIIVDSAPPVVIGIADQGTYCRKASFTVTELSLKSVTDNGAAILPAGGAYTITGDDSTHTITAVDDCGNKTSLDITVNRDHTWGKYLYNNDAACKTAGTKTAACKYGCGAQDTQIDGDHPALGHSYGNPSFLWGSDHKSCTAEYTCTRDASHKHSAACTVTANSPDASCIQAGTVTYTATAFLDGKTATDTKTISGVALGHDYKATFTWSEDKSSCRVSLVCQRPGCTSSTKDHAVNGLECTVETKTTPSTCTHKGKQEITATVTVDGKEYTDIGDSKELLLNSLNHANTQVYNSTAATCLAEGYTGDTFCNDCRKTVKTGSVIAQLEHSWNVGVYTKEATCRETGTILYTCTNGCSTSWEGTVPVNPNNHAGIAIVGKKPATETEDGYTGDTYCNDCQKTLAYGSVIPAAGNSSPVPGTPSAPSTDPTLMPGTTPGGDSTTSPTAGASSDPTGSSTSAPSDRPSAVPTGGGTAAPTASANAGTMPPDSQTPTPTESSSSSPTATPEASPGTISPGTDTPGSNVAGMPSGPLGTPDTQASASPSGNPGSGSSGKVPAKGSKIKDSKGTAYTVTKAGTANGTAAYTAPKNTKVSSVQVPDTVTIGGITYQVTSISKTAFAKCKKLKKVTIGKNIKRIGKKAFFQCSALKKVTIKTSRLTAKKVGAKAFEGIHRQAAITVPAKKLAAYKKILKKRGITGKKQTIKSLNPA